MVDPGPPPDGFICPESSVYAPGEARACVNFVSTTDLGVTGLEHTSSVEPSPSLATPSLSSASQSDPTADTDVTRSHDAPSTRSQGLSTGVKAAIGVLSSLSILALLSLLLCLHRRRRTKHRRSLRARIKHASTAPSTSSSPSRLVPLSTVSSRHGAPLLSPPLRLKDRRLLPTLMGGGGPSRRPGRPSAAFPTSPLCAPTTSKLVPRNENAPLPPFAPTPKPRSSASSRSTCSRASLRASAEPPARPPRPHDAPLEIPDLVAPDTPPERVLSSTLPAASPKTDIGLAVSRDTETRDSGGEYSLGRASWGSWGTRVVSPVLGEDELERMGGKYN